MNIIKTTNYFNRSTNELLEVNSENLNTREENLLLDSGIVITFFDDINEFKKEQDDFFRWYENRGLELKATLITINERIATILI